jgi:competence protein ComEC
MNNFSVVIRVTFGNNNFMFTGDAEDVSENEILTGGYNISSDLLKVGHHGSDSSTTQKFLDQVNPKYAIISAGKSNIYGHPTKSTMEKLRIKGAEVYRTDENGTIVASSDGENITFNTKPGSYNYADEYTSSGDGDTSYIPPMITPALSSNSKIIYHTPSGKSYHYDNECRTLARSKTVLSQTLDEALSSSHNDPCDICVD